MKTLGGNNMKFSYDGKPIDNPYKDKYVSFAILTEDNSIGFCYCLKDEYQKDEKFKELVKKVNTTAKKGAGNLWDHYDITKQDIYSMKCFHYMKKLNKYASKNNKHLFDSYTAVKKYLKENENVDAL